MIDFFRHTQNASENEILDVLQHQQNVQTKNKPLSLTACFNLFTNSVVITVKGKLYLE